MTRLTTATARYRLGIVTGWHALGGAADVGMFARKTCSPDAYASCAPGDNGNPPILRFTLADLQQAG